MAGLNECVEIDFQTATYFIKSINQAVYLYIYYNRSQDVFKYYELVTCVRNVCVDFTWITYNVYVISYVPIYFVLNPRTHTQLNDNAG